MSLVAVTCLAVQMTAVVLMVVRLRSRWTQHVGAWFLLAAFLFHGVSILTTKQTVPSQALESWLLVISPALLVYSVVYCAVVRVRVERPVADARSVVRTFPPQVLALLVAPLAIATLTGVGYLANGADTDTQGPYWIQGLSAQFLILGVTLLSFGIIVTKGRRWALPALLFQSILLASIGQRLEVFAGAVLLLYAMSRYGMRPSKAQLTWIVVVLVFLGLSITATRETEGRVAYLERSSASDRIGALVLGAFRLDKAAEAQNSALGGRIDGNTFGALVLGSLDEHPGFEVGMEPFKNSVMLAVPSFIFTSKLSTDITKRSDEAFLIDRLQLPFTDYLPTPLGGIVGYYGRLGLFLGVMILAIGLARVDTWMNRDSTPGRLVLGMSLMLCISFYERSFEAWIITARGTLLLLIAVKAVTAVRRTVRRAHWGLPVPAATARSVAGRRTVGV